jgi:hypothetical protein
VGLEQLEILSAKRVEIFILVQAMSGDRHGMGLKFWGAFLNLEDHSTNHKVLPPCDISFMLPLNFIWAVSSCQGIIHKKVSSIQFYRSKNQFTPA